MIRLSALLLTAMTGFSGLVYEVAWQRYLATLLGSQSEATAAVLALFLGGLSAGYALFGAVTRLLVARARRAGRPVRLLLVYGLVEAGIGGFALLFPTLFDIAQRLSPLVPTGHPGLGFGFDVGLSALLVGPPTILMGGTIPMLTLALAGDLAHSTRVHAWVYGCNTAGAFAGALAAAFWLVPSHGLDGTLYAMACLNLLAGGGFAALDRRARLVAPDFTEAAARPPARFAAYAAVALLAGFAMMTLQVILNRVGALALGSSPFTFAMIVAVFVLCIALGSLLVSALPRIPERLLEVTQWALFLLLVALYVPMDDAPYWAHVVRTVFASNRGAFYPYQIAVFCALLAVLALPIGLSGALLPLLFDRLRREVAELGAMAGRLYAFNTVGSLLGALLGGYILLLWLDLHQVYRVALAALALGAVILTALATRRSLLYMAGFVLVPAWLALLALPAWRPERLTIGAFRNREATPATFLGPDGFYEGRTPDVVFYDDDPDVTVSVVRLRHPVDSSPSIVVNAKSDGNLKGDFLTTSLAALLPALFARSHERCFVIGYGTGVTAGQLAALDGTRSVDVAEISRGVIEAAPIFDVGNLKASKNPRISLHRGDAYRTLQRTSGTYDVIVSEPSNPWVAGVEMLYSREFLGTVRRRLSPGGVYALWMQLYEIDEPTVALVLRTFGSVFPDASVWFAQPNDLLLLGFADRERALDVAALEATFRRSDFAAGFARAKIDQFPALLAHELLPLGTLGASAGRGEMHTLRHPILTDWAARAFFRGETATVPRALDPGSRATGAANSLLRRYAGVGPREPLPEEVLEPALVESCRVQRFAKCSVLSASWLHDHPDSERRRQIEAQVRQTTTNALASRQTLGLIAFLFRRDSVASGEGDGIPYRRVAGATERFHAYYDYAVPFGTAWIGSLWNQCRGDACQKAGRREAERLGFAYQPVVRAKRRRAKP